jgi:hypothetical protein
MRTIRRGVFETNSSSTHSITMVAKEDYDRWECGEVLFDRDNKEFVLVEEKEKYEAEHKWCDLQTSEDYFESGDLESFEETFTTKSGDKVVAFGKYGYDG